MNESDCAMWDEYHRCCMWERIERIVQYEWEKPKNLREGEYYGSCN